MNVTAKVVVSGNVTTGQGTAYEQVNLSFTPDYADGRNKEWAVATPGLSLSMTVKPEVAEHFPQGKAFTLTFTPED
jgi:hypothetical protein